MMQRLFSTFADGYPGVGLLVQRLLASGVLLYYGATRFDLHGAVFVVIPYLIGAILGVLLLLGLFTPFVGIAVVAVEIWTVLTDHGRDPLNAIVLAILTATLAMIGPGAWSLDARLFGRKHIRILGS